jgi:chromosome segregation ATPase
METLTVEMLKTLRLMTPPVGTGLTSQPYARGRRYAVTADGAVYLTSTGAARLVDDDQEEAELPPRPSASALSSAWKKLDTAQDTMDELAERMETVRKEMEEARVRLGADDTKLSDMPLLAGRHAALTTELEALRGRLGRAANVLTEARRGFGVLDFAVQRHELAAARDKLDQESARAVRSLAEAARRVSDTARKVDEAADAGGLRFRTSDASSSAMAALVDSVRLAALSDGKL